MKETSSADPSVQDVSDIIENKAPILARVRDFRITVAYLFINVHGGEADSNENPWNGKNGVMAKFRQSMNLSRGTEIIGILNEVLDCQKLGIRYTGAHEMANCGRKSILDINSVEAQIAVDTVESGSSLQIAWNLVNRHRQEEGLDSLTRAAVYGVIRACNPITKPILYRKQGSGDPESTGSKARLR
jgi:hypothetical protein